MGGEASYGTGGDTHDPNGFLITAAGEAGHQISGSLMTHTGYKGTVTPGGGQVCEQWRHECVGLV